MGRGARGSQRQRVRRARTGCKRIRAALKLFRCSAREFYETYNTYFRDAGRQLSEIRDAEVLLPAFDQLVEHQCTPAQRDGFAPLRLFLVARRRRIAGNPKAVERALSDFIRHMRVALVRLSSYKPAGEDFEVISGGLRLAFARGRRAYRAACRSAVSYTHLTRHFFATRIRSWLLMIFETAATISGVNPGASAERVSESVS